jgi:hypothetical protein
MAGRDAVDADLNKGKGDSHFDRMASRYSTWLRFVYSLLAHFGVVGRVLGLWHPDPLTKPRIGWLRSEQSENRKCHADEGSEDKLPEG